VIINDCMYIFGGYFVNNYMNDLYQYHIKSGYWQQLDASCVSVRSGHSAVVYKDYMFVFGGYGRKYRDDLLCYDFITKKWRQIKVNGYCIPSPRRYHRAVLIDHVMYIFAGYGTYGLCTEMNFMIKLNYEPIYKLYQ